MAKYIIDLEDVRDNSKNIEKSLKCLKSTHA